MTAQRWMVRTAAITLAGMAVMVVLGLAWCLLGCGPAQEARTADALGAMTDQAGAELATWARADTDCAGITSADCEERVYRQHEALWIAWEAYAAAWEAYASALEKGGEPSRADVERAGCRVVELLAESAPKGVRALCPRGTP